jgi:hypothetical protein
MLMCRGCNTRFESGRSQCPSCGRPAKTHAVEMSASDSGSSLPPMPANPEETTGGLRKTRAGVELDIDDSVIEDDDGPEIEEPEKEEVIPVRSRPAPAPTPEPARPARPPAAARKPAGPPTLSLDTAQVRSLIVDQPGLLEKGLGIHADAKGKPIGETFETPVGDIDLLARDLRGGFVIVLVPDDGEDPDLVPGLLRRMGWVRKHLCAGGETVRAVAVMNEVPESASYAAAGLAEGVIRFVGYRFALEFHDHSG